MEHNLLLREPEVNSVMLPKIQTDSLPERQNSLHEWLLTRFLHVYNPWKPIRVSVVISRTIPWITNASLMVLWFRYRCYTTICFVEVVFIDQANGMPYHGSMSNRSGYCIIYNAHMHASDRDESSSIFRSVVLAQPDTSITYDSWNTCVILCRRDD